MLQTVAQVDVSDTVWERYIAIAPRSMIVNYMTFITHVLLAGSLDFKRKYQRTAICDGTKEPLRLMQSDTKCYRRRNQLPYIKAESIAYSIILISDLFTRHTSVDPGESSNFACFEWGQILKFFSLPVVFTSIHLNEMYQAFLFYSSAH